MTDPTDVRGNTEPCTGCARPDAIHYIQSGTHQRRHWIPAPISPNVLAIDPGNTESAYALIGPDLRPRYVEKIPNEQLLLGLTRHALGRAAGVVAIEMVASYGMPVGAEVFETCVWIGRFQQAVTARTGVEPQLVKRHPVKLHHCHSAKAKDSNITQALVDRFAPGQPNRGKGIKSEPGWFYGFAADIWQAYALAVYVADTMPPAPAGGLPDVSPAVDAPPVRPAGETRSASPADGHSPVPSAGEARQEVLFP